MKMKKIVSVTAALAITMSAFAGLTLSAQAYDIPNGQEVKEVFIGSLGEDGSVTPETFDNYDISESNWDGSLLYPSPGISIVETTEVEKPEIGQAPGEGIVPTYVSGKNLQTSQRESSNDGRRYGVYNIPKPVSTGKLVFSGDFFMDGDNTTAPFYIAFFDEENKPKSDKVNGGTPILMINWKPGSSFQPCVVTVNGDATEHSSNYDTQSNYRTYHGCGIKNLVIDMDSGEFSFTLDAITRVTGNKHKRTQAEITGNIGTGKTIAAFCMGKDSLGQNTLNVHLDNAELYTVGIASGAHRYTINAVDENGEFIKQIDSGTAKENTLYSAGGLNEVLEKEGEYYRLDPEVTNRTVSYEMGSEDAIQTVTYKKDESIVAFTEGEDENNVKKNGGNSSYRGTESNSIFSGGWCVNHQGGSTASYYLYYEFTVPEKAQYTISGEVFKRISGSSARPYSIYLDIEGDPDGTSYLASGTPNSNELEPFSFETTLEKGTHKLIYSSYSNNASANLDYILVEKTGAAVEFTSKAEFLAKADEAGVLTGTLRFLSSPAVFGANAAITKYGFKLVKTDDMEIKDGSLDKSGNDGEFKTGDTFYYDITDIPQTITGSEIYAVPYVVLDNEQSVYGKPFGSNDFNWQDADIVQDVTHEATE